MGTSHRYRPAYASSWALVIGINRYAHASPLTYARNDAEAVADVVRSKFAFPHENVTLLLDSDATMQGIRTQFMAFADSQVVGPDDRVLVFFAGHGMTVPGFRGEVGFLLPADGNPSDLATLIRWDELTRNADLIPAKHVLFIMDACYGGLAVSRARSMGSMRFIGDMLQRYARQVLTAGKADETVADGSGVRPGHSLFTAHLLNALDGDSATEEGILTATGVMAYVYDKVGRDAYSHQTPHYGFIQGDGDFIFNVDRVHDLRAKRGADLSAAGDDAEAPDFLVNTSPSVVHEAERARTVVDELKELLSDPTKRIKLDDFVARYVREFLDASDLRHFAVQGSVPTPEDIAERIKAYEELCGSLQQIVILLATWGEGSQLRLLEKLFVRLSEIDRGGTGLTVWIRLGWYPVVYLAYSAGIAALAAENFEGLSRLLHAPVTRPSGAAEHTQSFVEVLGDQATELNQYFKSIPGHERHFVPLSEYLLKVLQPALEDLVMMGRRYEILFDRFEVVVALEYASMNGESWVPLGRFGWKHRHGGEQAPLRVVAREAERSGDAWAILRAGMFGGSADKLGKAVTAIEEHIGRVNWW
jgi:hypothetical protein